MEQQENKNWKQKLEDLEAEINQPNGEPIPQISTDFQARIQQVLTSGRGWFNTLPNTGKVAVAIGGVLIGIVVLNSVLKLVTSLLVIGVLGTILFLLYKFFISSSIRE